MFFSESFGTDNRAIFDMGKSLRAAAAPENSSVESLGQKASVEYTASDEVALVRRLDWHLLPGLSVLYFLCFLAQT